MNIKTQIKILLDESFGSDGLVDADRVNAVCDYIQQTFTDDKKISALKRYLRALLPELSRENVLIETSGKIDSETLAQLKNFAYRQTSRKNLRFNEKIDESLLGGVRITCADTIWEVSAADALKSIL